MIAVCGYVSGGLHRILLPVETSKKTSAKKHQHTENNILFEYALLKTKGARLETKRVQRQIWGIKPVSEGRSQRLNPFETKRKRPP